MRLPSIIRTLLLVAAFAAAAMAWPASAQAQGVSRSRGYYVVVQSGESLSDISQRVRVSAQDIARANRMPLTGRPAAGSRLFIPGNPSPVRLTRPTPRASVPAGSGSRPLIRTGSSSSRRPSPSVPAAPAPRPSSYTVQSGDSLWKVAQKFDVSISELSRANNISPDSWLTVGQTLRIPGPDSPSRIESPPSVGGSRGNDAISSPSTRSERSGGWGSRGSGLFSWPVDGQLLGRYVDSSTEKHYGLDIAAPKGTEVEAAASGTVVYAGSTIKAYGNMIIVQHDNGYASCYAFNDRLLVRVDQRVSAGDTIALSGDSGRRSEPYLHFQVRRNGRAVDPLPLLR